MNDHPLKQVLAHVDALLETFLQQRLLASAVLGAGAFLFLLLILAFTGAFALVLMMGVVIGVVGGGLVAGVFALHDRYGGDAREKWLDVADAIEAHLTRSDVFREWDEFVNRQQADPTLERIRKACLELPKKYPPLHPTDYCSPQGDEVLLGYMRELRGGVATRFLEEARLFLTARGQWRKQQQARAVELEERREAMVQAGIEPSTLKRSLRHLRHLKILLKIAAWVLARLGRGAGRAGAAWKERRAEKAAERAEQAALAEQDEALLDEIEDQEDEGQAADAADEDEEEEHEHEEVAEQERFAPLQPAPAPPPKKVAKKVPKKAPKKVAKEKAKKPAKPKRAAKASAPRQKGLTEARAIQKVMKAGFTAHDFDRKQEELRDRYGPKVTPADTMKALLKDGKRRKAGSGAVRRVDAAAHGRGRVVRARPRPPRLQLHRLVGLFVLVALPAIPFAAWRWEEGERLHISGDVKEPTIDPAPPLVDIVRAPFESLFGNRWVAMVNGPRIYMSKDDYDVCMAATGGTRFITVEAKRLRFGGFTVAKLIEVQTREAPPLVINNDPITPPPPKPERRRDEDRPPRAVIVNPR